MNECQIYGRLTEGMKVSSVNGERYCFKFTVACNRDYKDKDGNQITDFIQCEGFGTEKQVEYFKKAVKGARIVCFGEIHQNNYTKSNGEKVFTYVVSCNKVNIIDMPIKNDD